MVDWQPIQALPKGDNVLLGWWNCALELWECRLAYISNIQNGYDVCVALESATHWMPIPEPPEDAYLSVFMGEGI